MTNPARSTSTTATWPTHAKPGTRSARYSARARASEQVAALLNDLLARTAQPRLVEHEGVPLHLHVDAPGASWGGWLAASGAMALALLIAEHGTDVLGRCQAPGCAHVLLRTGPGPARRFCDNACASRTRVAAYRARQAMASGPTTSTTSTCRSRPCTSGCRSTGRPGQAGRRSW